MTFAMLGTGRGIGTVAVTERLNPGEARLRALLRLAVRAVRRSPRTPRSSVVQSFPKVIAPKTPDLGRFCLFFHGPYCKDFRKILYIALIR